MVKPEPIIIFFCQILIFCALIVVGLLYYILFRS